MILKLKIVFMGTPDFAKECLAAVYDANYQIIGVVTNPDRPRGRGMKMIPSDVKQYALEKNLPIYQPEKIRKNEGFIQTIRDLEPDLICVVAYGKILPKELLEIPKLGCINVHASLLPKYRGAAPIQWAVINGDKTTGITTMYMDEGMDTGDMILKKEIEIGENETTGELWNRLSNLGANMLVETIKQIENGTVKREKQTQEFSMAPMLTKQMAQIDWEEQDAIQIKNLVRGLNPIMGAYSYLKEKKLKFWKVENFSEEEIYNRFSELKQYENKLQHVIPGTVLFSEANKGLYINTKQGIIKVEEIQGENAKKMTIYDFLRGNPIEVGEIFKKQL